MAKKIDIPTSPEVITSDWLTEALRSTETIHQARVTSFQREFWWPKFSQKLKASWPDYGPPATFLELGHHFNFNVAKILTEWAQPPSTLVHNDTHVDNFLFGVSDDDAP